MGAVFDYQLTTHGQTITLQNRNIVPPVYGSVDFDEAFSNDLDVLAIVKTPRGKTFFDGVNTESTITHEIHLKYVPGVTAETWILFKGRRINILAVTNCCEQDEHLILTCIETGTKEAGKL